MPLRMHHPILISSSACRRGSGRGRLLLLIPPPLLSAEDRSILCDAFTCDCRQSPAVTFQWIVPADNTGVRIKAKNFSAGCREQIAAVKNDVYEITALEMRRPKLFACRRVQRYHRAFDAEINEL